MLSASIGRARYCKRCKIAYRGSGAVREGILRELTDYEVEVLDEKPSSSVNRPERSG